MKQTFLKHFGNYDVEFNRLLYPEHYKVLIRIEDENPAITTFYKSEDGWQAKEREQETWITNLFGEMINAINDNESSPLAD